MAMEMEYIEKAASKENGDNQGNKSRKRLRSTLET